MTVKSMVDIPFSPSVKGQIDLSIGSWPAVPFATNVAFDPKGRFEIQRDVKINGSGDYLLVLRLSDEEEKLKYAIGGGKSVGRENVGTPIPVILQLYALPENKLIRKKEIITHNTYAWARDYAAREIDHISLPAGDYKFIIQVPVDIPALAEVKATVNMGLRGKSSSTWQMTYIFWASLFYPVVLVIDVILFVIVCYKRVKARPNVS